MGGIKIISTGRALPAKSVSNDDLSKIVDTNDEWITTRTGIKNRYLCENESCASLAIEAARNAVNKAGIKVEDIGAVIVATSTPDTVFPSVACMVHKALGLSEDVMTFDLSAACTGFLCGLGTAKGLFGIISKKYILVIGSEQMSRIVDFHDRSTCILFGDGAGAAIISESDKLYLQKAWTRGDSEVLSCGGVGTDNTYLNMKGSEVFKFAVNAMQRGIDEILMEASLTMDDIDYVVCHQANARIISHVQKKYTGQEDKFYVNIEKYGNTSAASIPIALDELFEKVNSSPGTKILCVGFGAGLTFGSALIEL